MRHQTRLALSARDPRRDVSSNETCERKVTGVMRHQPRLALSVRDPRRDASSYDLR